MAVKISLFAAFAEFAGRRELELPHQEAMKCSDVWSQLQERYPRFARIPPLFAIHEEYVPAETEIKDGDVVMIFPPVSGGDAKYIFETPLSLSKAMEEIRDENGGGEAVFIGRVRRFNDGKKIQTLHYECELKMAEKEIDRLMEEMFAKWPLRKVNVQHRIGRLEVGDIAVIVAVSSEHRAEAFEACRYGIDELKRRVPIWKKEFSDKGEEWL